jgi:sn-glycerol 3-phosphate transport system substrate-binding protein
MNGHPAKDYKKVAQFISFLSSPEIQAEWHQFTGYLPSTKAAYELTKKQGYYDKNPGAETAILQMTLNPPTKNSKGVRIGGFLQIRDIINGELESIWSGKKTAKDALNTAVKNGNKVLRSFKKSNE